MMTTTSNNNNNHVFGHVAQGWEAVRSVFEQNLIDELDIGASLCVYYQGECVVNLCGGWKDRQTKKELYTPDTLQLVFSTSKGVIAAAAALCVEKGWLDYNAPVAQYWPEVAANEKQVEVIYELHMSI
jgi:CubicO group peptidase (beta-lactamase class C family)